MEQREPQWIIFGAGGHSKVILDVLLDLGDGRGIILLDDNPVPPVQAPPLVLPTAPILHGIGDLRVRRELQTQRYPDAVWPTIIANTAHVANVSLIISGAQILHHVYVGPDTIIGAGCIINNHASVDHDCQIGNFCHIAPGAVLCGGVSVGDGTLVAAGSSIAPGVRVGQNCIITLGSRVWKDIPDNSIFDTMGIARRNKHA